MRRSVRIWLPVVLLSVAAPAFAQAPAPPPAVVARDAPGDTGTALIVEWQLSPDDDREADRPRVDRYEIFRRADGEQEFTRIGEMIAGRNRFNDDTVNRGTRYWYQVVAVSPDEQMSVPAESTEPAVPVLNVFNTRRAGLAVFVVVLSVAVLYFVRRARTGGNLYIRRIAGLEAVDEAVGRATEMGRKCLFVPGIQDINEIQTVAGLTVLSRVSQLTAEYNADLEVPTARSLVMTAARETVESSYLTAGRPDAYNEDNIYYLTDEQFGYVAGVSGMMVRDKPAACFYMGAFYAESLILAETGNSIGAIQVAGTAESAQLPFFVAACDYTLIGEEFFAASAYLSGEPDQLGSLKGQDVGKLIAGMLIVGGCVLATIAAVGPEDGMLQHAVNWLRENLLGDRGLLYRGNL